MGHTKDYLQQFRKKCLEQIQETGSCQDKCFCKEVKKRTGRYPYLIEGSTCMCRLLNKDIKLLHNPERDLEENKKQAEKILKNLEEENAKIQ